MTKKEWGKGGEGGRGNEMVGKKKKGKEKYIKGVKVAE